MASHAIVVCNRIDTVPKEKHTAAYRLFHYPRPCMVQQMFTVSVEYVKTHGVITTGNPDRDRENRQAWVNQLLTAVEMCDMVDRGANIIFQDAPTATQVYLDLVEHLRNWLEIVQTEPMVDIPPIEELRQFDELAAMIFPYASPLLMAKEEDSGYGAFIARTRRGGRAMLSRTQQEPTQRLRKTFYQPLSDQIAESIFRRRS